MHYVDFRVGGSTNRPKAAKVPDEFLKDVDGAIGELPTQIKRLASKKLNGDQMVDAYRQLENTNFPTLQAATSPGEDFAESFVSYVHTVIMMNRPPEIRICRNGKIAKTYKSCWKEKRCAAKQKFLEDFLKSR